MEKFNNTEESFTGIKDDTEEYSVAITSFLRDYYSVSPRKGSYDSMTELHISGHNSTVLVGAQKGLISPKTIEVYYEKGDPKSIHVIYDNQGTGDNIDFYLNGRALENFIYHLEHNY